MYEEVEKALQVYTLDEIFELNDLTEEEVLYFLVRIQFLKLPDYLPL